MLIWSNDSWISLLFLLTSLTQFNKIFLVYSCLCKILTRMQHCDRNKVSISITFNAFISKLVCDLSYRLSVLLNGIKNFINNIFTNFKPFDAQATTAKENNVINNVSYTLPRSKKFTIQPVDNIKIKSKRWLNKSKQNFLLSCHNVFE